MAVAAPQEFPVDVDVASPFGCVVGVTEARERTMVNDLAATFVEHLGSTSLLIG